MRREVVGTLVRHVNLAAGDGMVIYSRLEPEDVEATVNEQIAYFEEIGQDFEWKVYSHDPPSDLKDRLSTRGFELGEDEAILVLDLEHTPAMLLEPITADLRRITDPEQIPSVIAVQNEVWQVDFGWLGQRLINNLRDRPDYVSVYAAYADDQPVAAAWINFPPENQFASLWGGSTLAGYRRRGLYTALLAVRVQEARQRGVRFLTVDASPMSRPILQKLGFQLIAYAYACVWKVEKDENREPGT